MKYSRFFSFAALLCMPAILAACAGGPAASDVSTSTQEMLDAYTLYTQAYSKTNDEEKLSYTSEIVMMFESGGVSMEIPIKTAVAYDFSGKDPRIRMEMIQTIMGQDIVANTYYANGMSYLQLGDEKVRQETDASELIIQEVKEDSIFSLPEQALKDVELTGSQDIGYTGSGTLPEEEIHDLLLQSLAAAQENSEEAMVIMEETVTFTDPAFTFTVDTNGYLSSYSLVFEVSGERFVEGIAEPVPILIKMEVAFADLQYGKQVRVMEPDNLDTYPEPARQLTEEEQQEILAALTDEAGMPVDNFNEVYKQLAEKYGQATLKAFFQ